MDGFHVCAQGKREDDIEVDATASAALRVGIFWYAWAWGWEARMDLRCCICMRCDQDIVALEELVGGLLSRV